MVEMSELAIIRDLEDLEEDPSDIEEEIAEASSGKTHFIGDDGNNASVNSMSRGYGRTMSSVDFRQLGNIIDENEQYLRPALSSYSVSIIPEESVIDDDDDEVEPAAEELGIINAGLGSNSTTHLDDMDNSRHCHNLNLGLDQGKIKISSTNFKNEETKSDCLDDMDTSVHSYNLQLGLDLDSSSHSDSMRSQEGMWCSRMSNKEEKEAQPDDYDDLSALDNQDMDNSSHRYNLSLEPKKTLSKRNMDNSTSSSNLTMLGLVQESSTSLRPNEDPVIPSKRRESPLGVMDLKEATPCTKNIEMTPKLKSLKKSKSMLSFPTLNLRSKRSRTKSISNDTDSPTLTVSSTKPLKSILRKSISMADFRNELKSSTTSEDTSLRASNTSESSTLSSSSTERIKRVTSFSKIEIREYNITLGDNPGGRSGPPISLDWKYNKSTTQIVDVDLYEQTRPPRRSRIEMHMGGGVRTFRLMREQGFSMTDMRKAAKKATEIRRQREKTIKRTYQRDAIKETVSKIFSTSKKPSVVA